MNRLYDERLVARVKGFFSPYASRDIEKVINLIPLTIIDVVITLVWEGESRGNGNIHHKSRILLAYSKCLEPRKCQDNSAYGM